MSCRVTLSLFVTLAAAACDGQLAPTDAIAERASKGAQEPWPEPGARPESPEAHAAPFLVLGYPPSSLTSDATHIYWSELGSVFRAAKTNPTREHLFGESTAAVALLVDETHVYATDPLRGTIRSWRKSDGHLEELLPGDSSARALAEDSEHLYIGRSGAIFESSDENGGGVLVLSKATRAQVSVLRAGASVAAVAVAGTTLVTAEGPPASFDIVRSAMDGGESAVVGHSEMVPRFVADENQAYWVDSAVGLQSTRGGGTLYAPSAPSRLLGHGIALIDGFAHVVESNASFQNGGQGPVVGTHIRIPLAGGTPEVLGDIEWAASAGVSYRIAGYYLTADADRIFAAALWSKEDGTRADVILTHPVRP